MREDEKELLESGLKALVEAIQSIAQGGLAVPGGLEGVGVAIAGFGLKQPLSESIVEAGRHISDAIESAAEAINNLASAIRDTKGE
jgi:hypothetical protein